MNWKADAANPWHLLAGCMLLDPDTVIPGMIAKYGLNETHWPAEPSKAAVEAIMHIYRRDGVVYLDKVSFTMFDGKWIDSPSDAGDIVESLINAAPSATAWERAATTCKQLSRVTAARKKANEIISQIDAGGIEDKDAFISGLPGEFINLAEDSIRKPRSNAEVCEERIEIWQQIHDGTRKSSRVQFGIHEIDEMLILTPGLHILAARPSCGKTSKEGMLRTNCAERGVPFATMSLDLDHDQLMLRDMCRRSGVSAAKLNHGHAGRFQRDKLVEAMRDIAGWTMPIYDMETCGDDIDSIISVITAEHSRNKIEAFSVDFIQQINAKGFKPDDNVGRLNHVASRLKKCGKRLGIPIIALCQLGRSMGKNPDGAPTLADLKGTGNFEQEAASVMMIWEEIGFDYSHPAVVSAGIEYAKKTAMKIKLAKQQNGATGNWCAWFLKPYFKFEIAEADWGFPGAMKKGRAA